jgi:uncharacterized protein YndB with AHSA1/START domain
MSGAIVRAEGEREMYVEREFAAPRALVWRCFVERALVAEWWGRGNRVDVERLEVERGGHWRFVEHADGQTHGFEGRVREVVPEERLSQTFEWDGLPGHPCVNTTTFVAVGPARTKLVTTSLFMTREERDGMMAAGCEDGMNASYAALDRVLARLQK